MNQMLSVISYVKKIRGFRLLGLIILSFWGSRYMVAQTLDDYVEMAKRNSLVIKEKTYEFALATESINEVGVYEDPQFLLGVFATTPETRVGAQVVKVGVNQKIPWRGKLKAAKHLAKERAVVPKIEISLAEKKLGYQVKALYYDLYQKQAVQEILKEQKHVLGVYEKMVTHAMANGLSAMSDVLEIRVQENELHSKIFQNYNEIEGISRNFNRLLERDVETTLNIPTTLNVLDILIGSLTIDKHPLIESMQQRQQIYEAESILIDKINAPQIAIGIDYILVNKRTDIFISENGKDIWMPKISLEIPISSKKKKSQKSQVEIKKDQLFYQIENQKRTLEIALETARFDFHNAMVQVVAAQKNTEETQRIIDLYIKDYEVGTLKYDKILQLQLKKIRYQLMEVEAIKNAFMAKSWIEYLVD